MGALNGFPQVAPFQTSEFKTTSEYGGANLGSLFTDGNGNIFQLVDCQEAFVAGEVVVINQAFQASQATSTSRGAIGVLMSTPTTSDTYAWAQVYGSCAIAICASGVTSTGVLVIPATSDVGYFGEGTSSAANRVFGALSRAACSTATTPGGWGSAPVGLATVQLLYPYVNGVATDDGQTT